MTTTAKCDCQDYYTDNHSDDCQYATTYGGETGIRGRDDRRERIAQRDRY